MGCGTSAMNGMRRHAYIIDGAMELDESYFLEHEEFEFGGIIQTGGVGQVYRGIRKVDKRPVAMKIFGYTPRIPTEAEVNREIRHMLALNDIPGCIQLLGLFKDSDTGLVPGKLCHIRFPIVVMELVDGGDFLARVLENRLVSEKILSQLFKALIKTLSLIHERGFIHRDIKLENLLFCKYETYTTIKVIDLGMMVQLAPRQSVYRSDGIQGTPGYLAPESVTSFEYSAATDMWQAGCCLYTMLSAESAFNDDNLHQITNGEFNEMKGFSWVGISDEAKSLVTALLTKDKTKRITAQAVLMHPWIEMTSTGVNLEKEYYSRIKALSLRRNLRGVFKLQNIISNHNKRKVEFADIIQSKTLARGASSRRGSFSSTESPKVKVGRSRSNSVTSIIVPSPRKSKEAPSPRNSLSVFVKSSFMSGDSDASVDVFGDVDFQKKLANLRKSIVCQACPQYLEKRSLMSAKGTWLVRNADCQLSLETFSALASSADLPQLANRSAFALLSVNAEGAIDQVSIVDALLGLLAMKAMPSLITNTTTPTNSKGQITIDANTLAASQIYYNLFDIESNGQIRLSDLKLVIGLLLNHEFVVMSDLEVAAIETHIDELFLTINLSKTGTLDFEEFKKFFASVMLTTSQLRYSRASTQEFVRSKKVLTITD